MSAPLFTSRAAAAHRVIDHADVSRDDITPVLAELVRRPGIRRRILELI
ncbi:hypothetical protein [Streptomyces sp. NPDC002403]